MSSEVAPSTRARTRSTGSLGGEGCRGGWRNLVNIPDLSSSNCVFAKFASSRCPFANFGRFPGVGAIVEVGKGLVGAFVEFLDDERTSAC
jgi:hypothetical protein